jgi:hypothetical protein
MAQGASVPAVGESRTQVIGGFTFPSAPGPPRLVFPDEATKWREIVRSLRNIRGCLARSDRAFYRELIGLESMALRNGMDRAAAGLSSLEEPILAWLDGANGPSS